MLLLICCVRTFPFFCGGSVFVFVRYALLCVLSSKSSKRKRVLVVFFTNVLVLYIFCSSSLRCLGLVCSVLLWYFLIILTYFFYLVADF